MNIRLLQKRGTEMIQVVISVVFCSATLFRVFISFFALLASLYIFPHAFALSTQSASPALITNGLVGWLTFDGKNMSSTTATDTSGQGNNGTLNGSPLVTLGKAGQAIRLNGSNQYVNLGNGASVNFTADMSISFFINPSASQVSFANIINKHGSGNAGFTLQQNSASTNAYAFAWGNGSGYTCDSTTLFTATANIWQHVVVVKSGALVTAYVNGVQSGTCTGSFSTIATNSDNVNIGRWTSGASRYFGGSLDDMRLYNRALTAQEIAVLAGTQVKPVTVDKSSLVGHWSFDKGYIDGTTVKDQSGYGNNATLTNGISTLPGKIGQGLNLVRASSQYASAPASASLNFSTGPNTVAMWLYPTSNTNFTAVFAQRSSCANNFSIQVYTFASTECGSNNEVTYQLTSNGGTSYALCAPRLPLNQWTHLVGTYDGSTMRVYQNGALATSSSIGSITLRANSVPTYIGYDSCNNNHFNGRMDDVRLYSRGLSSTEVLSLYKTKAVASSYGAIATSSILVSNGLVGYWTFDGKTMTSSTSTDSSGAAKHGALNNNPPVVLGKVGQGISFNGSNQYVDVGNNPLVGATKFTYSAWVQVSLSDFSGAIKMLVDDSSGDPNANTGMFVGLDDRGGSGATAGLYADFKGSSGSPSCLVVNASNIFSTTRQWYHIALTYNGISTPTLYINGVSVSYTTSPCNGSGSYVPRSANMYLGATNTGANAFKGVMDEVRLYNRALSLLEVQTLFKLGGR